MSDPVLTFDTNCPDSQAEFITYRDGSLGIELNHPWAGDSETGFGRSLSCTLTPAQTSKLTDWLIWYEVIQKPNRS